MTQPNITVYSKNDCGQCSSTYKALDRAGLDYTVRMVDEDPEALAIVKELGYLQAPVVVAGDTHWSGFRPGEIAKLKS